jgi:hypothetical protein
MNEFKISDLLKLRLENGKTSIYIKDNKIIQCKYLLLNNANEDNGKNLDNSENLSVDDQAGLLDHSLELDDNNEARIPPETEFWAHCSNLQAWYENSYDTQVLHTNLAFPLLRKLSHYGDKLARKVLKTEIMKRFRSGDLNVMTFLVKEGYLDRDHLDIEDSELLYDELDFEFAKKLRKRLKESSGKNERFIV